MKFFGGKKDKAAVFLPASEGDFKIVRREGTGCFGGQRQGAQGGQGVRSAQNAAAPLRGPIPFAVCGDPFARRNGSAVESAGAVRGTCARTDAPAAEHALEEGFARLSRLAGLNVAERLAARG